MKPKLVIAVILGGVALGALAFAVIRPDKRAALKGPDRIVVLPTSHQQPQAPASNPPALPSNPPPLPVMAPARTATVAQPVPRGARVAIVEGKTIDFSSGAPIVSDSAKDQAALEAGLREIELAEKESAKK